jgi:hypothetical protein
VTIAALLSASRVGKLTSHLYLSMTSIPLDDIDRPRSARLNDQDGRALGQRPFGPGQEGLGTAADLDEHLARPGVAPSRYEENW